MISEEERARLHVAIREARELAAQGGVPRGRQLLSDNHNRARRLAALGRASWEEVARRWSLALEEYEREHGE